MAFRNRHGQLVVVNPDSPMHNPRYAAQVYARDRYTLEWGEANELFTGYITFKPKQNRNKWLARRLAEAEDLYGAGAADRIRAYMGRIKQESNWNPD